MVNKNVLDQVTGVFQMTKSAITLHFPLIFANYTPCHLTCCQYLETQDKVQ